MKKSPPTLSRRERQIMDAVYRLRSGTVADVRSAIQDPPSYSSVRTLLGVLEDKGHLSHRRDGQRYVYAPTVPREAAGGAALARVVQTFFGGSLPDLVSTLLDNPTDPETLDELASLIAQARKETE
jgi:BlaI family transcriptional regulator, penicillinase repressor